MADPSVSPDATRQTPESVMRKLQALSEHMGASPVAVVPAYGESLADLLAALRASGAPPSPVVFTGPTQSHGVPTPSGGFNGANQITPEIQELFDIEAQHPPLIGNRSRPRVGAPSAPPDVEPSIERPARCPACTREIPTLRVFVAHRTQSSLTGEWCTQGAMLVPEESEVGAPRAETPPPDLIAQLEALEMRFRAEESAAREHLDVPYQRGVAAANASAAKELRAVLTTGLPSAPPETPDGKNR